MTHQPKSLSFKWTGLQNISSTAAPPAVNGNKLSAPATVRLGIALRYLAANDPTAKIRLRTQDSPSSRKR